MVIMAVVSIIMVVVAVVSKAGCGHYGSGLYHNGGCGSERAKF